MYFVLIPSGAGVCPGRFASGPAVRGCAPHGGEKKTIWRACSPPSLPLRKVSYYFSRFQVAIFQVIGASASG